MSQENKSIRPEYYNIDSLYEPIKIIQHYGLCFEISNVLKYCLRAGVKNKDTEIEDLVKAKTYLQLRIDYLQAQKDLTINIKCENNLSPVIEVHKAEIKDIVNSWKKEKPKLISELKVGDEIKAIDDLYMDGSRNKEDLALIKDKIYSIKSITKPTIMIASEYDNAHTFYLSDLHEYFHVTE